jgi:hypothetical protein
MWVTLLRLVSVSLLAVRAHPVLAIAIESGPALILNPSGNTPLAGVVEVLTDVESAVTLSVSSAGHSFDIEFSEFATEHFIPVLGLRPDAAYSVELHFRDREGNMVQGPLLSAVTSPLPPEFPIVDVLASQPAKMERGYTLVDRIRGDEGFSMILDAQGEVVWYSRLGGGGMLQLHNGNLFWRNQDTAEEWTLLGERVSSVPMGASHLHHDLHPTVHGTYLSLSREAIIVPDYPTSETDPSAPPAPAAIRDEPVVELLPGGTLLNRWRMSHLIDPTRIGYNALTPTTQGYDWVHNNAVFHDARDDSIIVSARHQDAVIKFSRETGELRWILGTHVNWKGPWRGFLLTPIGSLKWPYHQHAPMVTTNGTLLLFDNGNNRSSPYDGVPPLDPSETYSRAVEYEIDEERFEVRQLWEYPTPAGERIYSGFISDADWMTQTGNVLVHFGAVSWIGGERSVDLGGRRIIKKIIEVTHETPAERVFDVRMYAPPDGAITAYRSERIPSLYRALDRDADGMLDAVDPCPFVADDGSDTDGNGIGDSCECGDQSGDGTVSVADLLAVNSAIFDPSLATPLCDTNDDDQCDVQDLLGVNAKIFGAPAYCAKYPAP